MTGEKLELLLELVALTDPLPDSLPGVKGGSMFN